MAEVLSFLCHQNNDPWSCFIAYQWKPYKGASAMDPLLQQKEPVVQPACCINGSGNCPNGDNLIRALRVIPVE